MKIICINNSDILNGLNELLTIDKTYETIKISQGQYYIKDNSGEERWYNDNRFKDIATIRKEKLKQLGI
jgi:hypothetical protein